MSNHTLITSASTNTPTLTTGDFLWRPCGRGLDSSFWTSLSPRAPELGPLPAINADLLALAILVYLADRTAPRPRGRELATRELELSVPVADPDPWVAATAALEDLLRFLSGDEWRLSFTASRPTSNQPASKPPAGGAVCLLSGGADSLAGALLTHQDDAVPALVSHWDWTIISGFQSRLVHRLQSLWGVKVQHVRHQIGRRKHQLGTDEAFPRRAAAAPARSCSSLWVSQWPRSAAPTS